MVSMSNLHIIFGKAVGGSDMKNTKNWYTIDALGAIFAIFTILDTFTILLQFYYNTITILLQYFYNTFTILLQ